jgi:hypothetical protein
MGTDTEGASRVLSRIIEAKTPFKKPADARREKKIHATGTCSNLGESDLKLKTNKKVVQNNDITNNSKIFHQDVLPI